jgi:hypothetical protein
MHLLVSFLAASLAAAAAARVGDAWGTNIHYLKGKPGETAALSTAYKVARMDFLWATIESTCGAYDFSQYDALLAEMQAHGVKPYWILDYNNENCYPSPGSSCATDACIAGYGRFAAATAAHFAGQQIIFESVNEANGMGQDNATVITALCKAAGAHFLAAGETFVGPTTAGVDFPYLNATFAGGILSSLTGVSVHPYRSGAPESATADLEQLAALIASYRPGLPALPILSGEWGYTSAKRPCDYGNRASRAVQGKFVPRMWLSALLGGAVVSINYDWKNDGTNESNCEDNFGSVEADLSAPKPAFRAALAAQTTIGNASTFVGRVPAALAAPAAWNLTSASAFVLAFAGGLPQPAAFAVWTNLSTCVIGADAGARAPCGGAGVDEAGCMALGCCFDEDVPAGSSAPACYVAAAPASVPAGICPADQRADCGFRGISHDECVNTRGCCWDSSPTPVGPQCFWHADHGIGGPLNVSFAVAPAADDACFAVVDVFGFARQPVCAVAGQVTVTATDGPAYLL